MWVSCRQKKGAVSLTARLGPNKEGGWVGTPRAAMVSVKLLGAHSVISTLEEQAGGTGIWEQF